MAQRFGGRFSPGPNPATPDAKPPRAFGGRPAAKVSVRARMMFLLPAPLFFAALGSIGRGAPAETLAELGGFVGLILSAWLLNEGLRAEAAFAARTVARPPSIPRKIFAAVLAGASVFAAGLVDQGLGAAAFGLLAGLAQLAAFGLDPMKAKGIDGADDLAADRVAKAIDQGEGLVREIVAAAARIGDKRLEGRIERLCDQAREVFRAIEADARDLTRARTFLHVYLRGLRDATVKFADLNARGRDRAVQTKYEALVADLETSFSAHRAGLLIGDRSDLDVEIEVLRERLQQDGLIAR